MMIIKKGEKFITKNNKIFMVAGKWAGDYVLIPEDENDENCSVYGLEDIEEYLQSGYLKRI